MPAPHPRPHLPCVPQSQVSKWDYLFSCVGQPQKSFQRCMNTGQLATAASYLMVMQALQPAEVTRHQSLLLLQCALGEGQWELGRDLLRFLKVGEYR